MKILWVSFAFVLFGLAGCQESGKSEQLTHQLETLRIEAEQLSERDAAVRTELQSFGVVASDTASEAVGLREDPGNRILDLADLPVAAPKPQACPGLVITKVRAEAGVDCNSYTAEIAGWSDQCVTAGNCDPATRLAEVVLAARFECKAFCDAKGCKGPTFQAPAQCASKSCAASGGCPAACPLRDDCFLLQATRVWNCVCIEL